MYYIIGAAITKDVTFSLRIDRKLSDKLERHAKQAKRSKSSFAAIAIENYLEIEAREIEKTKRALARAKAGGPFVAHEDVMRWMESWGTEKELPRPKATIKL
jgi:RHH-type transcriptional regulator, rel operon repressor / antitoxin RelB